MDSSLTDRISDLPSHIINYIFDRIPIRDAVATSILSKEWTHKWRRLGNLVFNTDLVDQVIHLGLEEKQENINQRYCDIIGNILLLHIGTIQKFVLHVPKFDDGLPPELNSWMTFLSQKEVKELEIEAPDIDIFRLPSNIYDCSLLQHLKLDVCTLDLNIPRDFDGFSSLLSLDLYGTPNIDELSSLIYSCPRLERLTLILGELKEILVIDAPRLCELSAYCRTSGFLHLKNASSVTNISITYGYQTPGSLNELINIVSAVPKVEICSLYALEYYSTDMPLEVSSSSLPATFNSLRSLTLSTCLQSRSCVSFLLHIIKNSPNLQELILQIVGHKPPKEETALRFLKMQKWEPQTLNNLRIVQMSGLAGDQFEIVFIKLILSCSPVLNTINLTGGYLISDDGGVKMLSELQRCPRSSCQAQVVYRKFPVDFTIFY